MILVGSDLAFRYGLAVYLAVTGKGMCTSAAIGVSLCVQDFNEVTSIRSGHHLELI